MYIDFDVEGLPPIGTICDSRNDMTASGYHTDDSHGIANPDVMRSIVISDGVYEDLFIEKDVLEYIGQGQSGEQKDARLHNRRRTNNMKMLEHMQKTFMIWIKESGVYILKHYGVLTGHEYKYIERGGRMVNVYRFYTCDE
jgi:hypothetical protein